MAYIFLDESGDLGFNPKKKNSKYFLVTILSIQDKRVLEKIVKKIHRTLRKKVKRLSGGVLHANKEKPTTRKRLLRLLSKQKAKVIVIYLDKSRVYTKLQNEKHTLYNYVVNILLDRIMRKRLVDISEKINLIASKRETNKFLNDNFKQYLKSQVKNRHKLEIGIDIKTPGEEKSLQAVDFVSWALFRKYEYSDRSYYDLIKAIPIEESGLFTS